MIKLENPNGFIEVTNNYFANLVGRAAQSCFGVTGMVNSNAYQSIKSVLKNKSAKENLDQGVTVKSINEDLMNFIFLFHTVLISAQLLKA